MHRQNTSIFPAKCAIRFLARFLLFRGSRDSYSCAGISVGRRVWFRPLTVLIQQHVRSNIICNIFNNHSVNRIIPLLRTSSAANDISRNNGALSVLQVAGYFGYFYPLIVRFFSGFLSNFKIFQQILTHKN